MRIDGKWLLCDDGFMRPVIRGEILAGNGSWLPAEFLVETGADCTVFNALTLEALRVQPEDGTIPLLEWFDEIPIKAQDKCRLRIERLRDLGHELRRPEADYLRDEIYELRVSLQGVNYRMLYFFHGNIAAAVVSHGLIKERIVPPKEIDRALERKRKFIQNPKCYAYGGL